MTEFVLATGASKNHSKSLAQFLRTVYNNNRDFNFTCVVYDLGLKESLENILELQKSYPFVLETFDYSKYPEYFQIEIAAGEYAWKPVIIEQVMEKYNPSYLLWCDSGNIIGSRVLAEHKNILDRLDIYSPNSDGNIRTWTYPAVIEILSAQDIEGRSMRNAAILGFHTSKDEVKEFVRDFSAKAQLREYIAPEGSSRKNHRQDQSLFTILYYRFLEKYPNEIYDGTHPGYRGILIHQDCD